MTVNIDGVVYSYKTNFAEFTLEEYVNIIQHATKDNIEKISIYTGIPVEKLNKIQLENLGQIIETVRSLENSELLAILCDKYEGKNIGVDTYGKFEKAKQLMKGSNLFVAIPAIVELYTGELVKDKPLLETWNICLHYINSISDFLKRFKRLNEHVYSDEEIEAEVERLEGFAHWATVFKIAKERGMSNDAVLNMTAIEVYTEMLYEFERNEYTQRYNEVIKQRQEHFNKVNVSS